MDSRRLAAEMLVRNLARAWGAMFPQAGASPEKRISHSFRQGDARPCELLPAACGIMPSMERKAHRSGGADEKAQTSCCVQHVSTATLARRTEGWLEPHQPIDNAVSVLTIISGLLCGDAMLRRWYCLERDAVGLRARSPWGVARRTATKGTRCRSDGGGTNDGRRGLSGQSSTRWHHGSCVRKRLGGREQAMTKEGAAICPSPLGGGLIAAS